MQEKSIPDVIQEILDKNRGFAAISQLPKMMPAEFRQKLGIKSNEAVKILIKKLEPVLEDRFIFRKKGNTLYVLTPCDPAELVMAELSEDKPAKVSDIAKNLKFLKNSDIAAILTELINSGRVRVELDEKFAVKKVFSVVKKIFSVRKSAPEVVPDRKKPEVPEEYTLEKFKAAFDELDRGKVFVKIAELRRRLDWPREVFDRMLRSLRDNNTAQIYAADESTMTPDEIADCFIDENNYRMGTMTWNV